MKVCRVLKDEEDGTQSQDETSQRVRFAQHNALMNKTLSKARASADDVMDASQGGVNIVGIHPECPLHGRNSGYRPAAVAAEMKGRVS